jgi:hypothetical protein
MRIKSLGFEYEARVTGPEEYESRTMKFSAWADLGAEALAGETVVVRDPAQTPADVENAEEAREAAAQLCAFVKETLSDEMRPFLDYRAALRRSRYNEVRDGLPRHLRQFLAPEAVLTNEGGNGHG